MDWRSGDQHVSRPSLVQSIWVHLSREKASGEDSAAQNLMSGVIAPGLRVEAKLCVEQVGKTGLKAEEDLQIGSADYAWMPQARTRGFASSSTFLIHMPSTVTASFVLAKTHANSPREARKGISGVSTSSHKSATTGLRLLPSLHEDFPPNPGPRKL